MIEAQLRRKLVRFFLLFLLISVGLFALFYFWKGGTRALQRWTALVSAGILKILGFSTVVDETTYFFSGVAIEIIPECTGLYEIIVFSAIVLAFPATIYKKIAGVIGGALILILLNLIRLLILALVGMRSREWMDWVHLYLWQLTLILFVVGLFLLWLSWARKPPGKVGASSAHPERERLKPPGEGRK
ncbi:MAG: exosortase H [Caldiserica bacterium]|nr:exosortase H [Caldisericota bacterium]MDH7562613.1 exosortase H [Caldisericota bacterium]